MNKKVLIILILSIITGITVSAIVKETTWGDSRNNGNRESINTEMYSPSRYAFDNNEETYWKLKAGEKEGWTEKYYFTETDIEGAEISGTLSEDSEIEFFYEEGGTWIPYENGKVKGPLEGKRKIIFTKENRKTRKILTVLKSENSAENKINEINFIEKTNSLSWGKITPVKYSFNQDEYINLSPSRLWNGHVKETWFEPIWYVQWDIQQTNEGKSGIFAPYMGNPPKNAEIIWELDSEYRIDTIKAYFDAEWRSIAFEFWNGKNWVNKTEFKNSNKKGWNRIDLNQNIKTEKVRITFPQGWENSRFINQIELWGEGERAITSENILFTSSEEQNKYTATINTNEKDDFDLEVITTKNTEDKGINISVNGESYTVNKAYLETENERIYKTTVNREYLRTDYQYIEVTTKSEKVLNIIRRKHVDDGRLQLSNGYTDDYTGYNAEDILSSKKEIKLDRKYEIEKIVVYSDINRSLKLITDEKRGVSKEFNKTQNGKFEIELKGQVFDKVTVKADSDFVINEIEIFGSPVEDKEPSIEMWSNNTQVNGKSCILGWKGSRESQVIIDNNIYPRQEGNLYWIPVSEVNNSYLNNTNHSLKCMEGQAVVQKKYYVNKKDNTNEIKAKINENPLLLSIDIPYGELYTQLDYIEISGRCGNGEDIQIYVNQNPIENVNNTYKAKVLLEEGMQTVTVKAHDKSGRTVEKTIKINRDSINPKIKLLTPEEGEYSNTGTILFTVDGTEDDELWWQFNDEPWEQGFGKIKYKTYALEDGFYSYTVQAQDRAGNISNVESVNFCMDETKPDEFEIKANVKGWTNNNKPTVEFETRDATSGIDYFEYKIDENDWKKCESPLKLEKLEDGIRKLSVRVFDKAGNVTNESLDLYIDTSNPPEPTEARPVAAEKSIIMKWFGIDDGEDYRSYRIERNPAWKDGIKELKNVGYGKLQYEDTETTVGEKYEYRMWSVDRAGNESQKTDWKSAVSGIAITEVNKNGNTIVEYDGMTITLPKGSMAEDIIRVQIHKLTEENIDHKPINPVMGSTFMTTVVRKKGNEEIITNHANLLESATVEISYNPNLLPEGYVNSEMAAFYYDDIWGYWMQMPDSYINTENNTMLFKTNHFTEFNVQATKKAVLSEAELRGSAYKLNSGDVGPEEIRISGEDGGVSLRFTELKLPGKNGLDFAIERTYSTGQAYSDACELKKDDNEKTEVDIDGEREWKIANGWKINVPSIKINGSTIAVNGLNGCSSNIGQMTKVGDGDFSSSNGANYQITMENHEYSDFRVRFEFKKETKFNWGLMIFLLIPSTYDEYSFKGATLYQNDGKILYFDNKGKIESIKDCTEKNAITFTYGDKNTITDSLGNVIEFEKKDGYITKISQGTKTISYTKSEEKNLKSATDIGGRVWNYEYEKITLTNSSELSDPSSGYTQPEPKSYDVYAVKEISGSQIGYTKIEYDTKTFQSIDNVDSYNFVISSMKLFAKEKQEGLSKDNILRTTKYELIFNSISEEKQFFVTESIVDNGLMKVKTEYGRVTKARKRLSNAPEALRDVTGNSGSVNTQQEDNNQILTYAKKVQTYAGNLVSTEENAINEQLMRVEQTTVTKAENNTVVSTYDYQEPKSKKIDGNIYSESHVYKTGGHESSKTITRTYYSPINNRTNLIKTIETTSSANDISNTTVSETYMYNDYGQMITKIISDGADNNVYNYAYGNDGQISSIKTPEGKITKYTYNYYESNKDKKDTDDNNQESTEESTTESANNSQESSIYEITTIKTRDKVSTDTDEKKIPSLVEKSVYDKTTGKLITYTDPDGYVTVYSYDVLGRLTNQEKQDKDPANKSTITIVYDDTNLKSVVTNELGAITTNCFDNLGRLTSVSKKESAQETAKTITTTLSYDAYDRVISISEPSYGNSGEPKSTYTYDNQSRLKMVVDSDNNEIKYEYNDLTNTTTKIKGSLNPVKTRVTKDNLGNVIKTENWVKEDTWTTEEVFFDGEGREVKRVDGKGNITKQTYNELGLPETITYPNGLYEIKTYNKDGMLTEITRKDSNTSTSKVLSKESYSLDDFGRVITKIIPVSPEDNTKTKAVVETYTYDGRGNVLTQSISYNDNLSDIKTVSSTYDYLGNLETQTDGINNTTQYKYDTAGNLTKLIDSRDAVTTYNSEFFMKMEYDKFGRLVKGWTPHNTKRQVLDDTTKDVTIEYNAQGDVVNRTDREGVYTEYQYSKAGRLEKTIIDGYTTSYEYNEAGLLYKQTNPDGVVTINYYDGSGRVEKQYIGEGTSVFTKNVYDGNGNIQKTIDRNGNITTYTYNEMNLVTNENVAGLTSMTYTYDKLGRKTSETDGENNTRTYVYDGLNRVVKEITPEGYSLEYEYDARGNVTLYTDAKGTKFVRTYTKNDLLNTEDVYKKDSDIKQNARSYSYDEGGVLKQISYDSETISYNGEGASYQSNAYGNINSMKWSSTGFEMKYEYDGLNRLSSVTTPDGKENIYTYNHNSQITGMSDFIAGNITYSNTKLSSYTTMSGITKSFGYDSISGVITNINYNSDVQNGNISNKMSYIYDDNFNIKTRTIEGLTDSFNYDGANRLVSSVISGNIQSKDWAKPKINEFYEIERDLNCQKDIPATEYSIPEELILDSKGKSFVYSFGNTKTVNKLEFYPNNTSHRVRKCDISVYTKDGQNDTWHEVSKTNWKFSSDESNKSIHIEFKNAVKASSLKIHNNWDDRDLFNISHDNFATFKNTKDRMIRVWFLENERKEDYGYDGNSNRTGLTVDGTVVSGIEYYKNNMGGNTPMIKFDGEWYYTYDENGNRISKGKTKTAVGSSYITATATSNGAREGNVIINTLDEYWTYEWDLYNRLVKVKQFNAPDGDSCKEVSYEYDALNFRTKRTSILEGTVTEYAYGRNGALTYEKFTKNSTVEGSRTYAYLNDQIIGFTDSVGSLDSKRYAVTDIQGSVNEIYNEEGSLLWKSGYTAFGELAGESVDKLEGVFEFHGMYTGCQIDAETGLTYHWNRWRNENGSQFITQDPARDGINWFGYAGQNPVNKIDPNGLNTLDDFVYQKRTEDSDKSAENQRKYDHEAREYALRNQGLTDYGMAIHNNEEFFYNFMDQNFNANNPLNQLDLDRALGYKTTLSTTQSCLLAALFNGYGVMLINGISGAQILASIFDESGNFRKDSDGKSFFKFEKSNDVSAPYLDGSKLWSFSLNIGNVLNLKQGDFNKYDPNNNTPAYINPTNPQLFNDIKNNLSHLKQNSWYGILKQTAIVKNDIVNHFVFVDNLNMYDSLPANRPNKPDYTYTSFIDFYISKRK